MLCGRRRMVCGRISGCRMSVDVEKIRKKGRSRHNVRERKKRYKKKNGQGKEGGSLREKKRRGRGKTRAVDKNKTMSCHGCEVAISLGICKTVGPAFGPIRALRSEVRNKIVDSKRPTGQNFHFPRPGN